uniref:C2H2-type domain-containing protein n=1 Tax=Oryzias latipes TaxID=8090 RepID=A0A3P9IB06_ORYLA
AERRRNRRTLKPVRELIPQSFVFSIDFCLSVSLSDGKSLKPDVAVKEQQKETMQNTSSRTETAHGLKHQPASPEDPPADEDIGSAEGSSHSCRVCGQLFHGRGFLLKHAEKHSSESKTHTGQKPFRCKDCGKEFPRKGSLERHMRLHAGERPYICEFCGKTFIENTVLKRHIKSHTGGKPRIYPCEVCGKKFTMSQHLDVHKRIHTGEKPYTCRVCNKSFRQIGNLDSHMRIHTGEKPFICSLCGKSYAQRGNLKMHMAMHRGETTVSSSRLQHSQTESRTSLRGPEQTAHSDPHPRFQASPGLQHVTGNGGVPANCWRATACKKSYSCSECGKRFGFKGQLASHMRAHTGEKPFRCPVCWKCFSWNACLQKHKKIHTGEKPYRCTVCGKGFIESGNMKVHMRIHTGEKPFNCSECGKRYRQKGSLTKHMDVHRELK